MFVLKPFKSIFDLLKAFPDEQSCISHLEQIRWKDNVTSPFKEGSKVYKCAGNKYRCKETGKYFNVRKDTIFEGTKIPLLQWFLAIYLFTTNKKGISSYLLAKNLNVTQKTAWFMLSRIRYAMCQVGFMEMMTGVVQVDETFVGGKNKNRHADKKVKYSQGRSFKDKTPVVGMLDVDRKLVRCIVAPNTSSHAIRVCLRNTVQPGAIVVSDDWHGYNGIDKWYNHQRVDHRIKQYVNDIGATTNGIENFWTNFKNGLIGVYNNRATRKHLQKYADEFTFRYNNREQSVTNTFNLFLQQTPNRRLKYKQLIAA